MQVNAMDKMCTKNELGLQLECTWNELGITLECPWSELGNDLGMNLVSTWNAPGTVYSNCCEYATHQKCLDKILSEPLC